MKTIEEAAKEYANIPIDRVIDEEERYFNSDVIYYDAFNAGAEFAQRWIPVEEELPICEKLDRWDGYVLVLCSDKYWTKAKLFSNTVNGELINEWYAEDGNILPDVTHWRPVEIK